MGLGFRVPSTLNPPKLRVSGAWCPAFGFWGFKGQCAEEAFAEPGVCLWVQGLGLCVGGGEWMRLSHRLCQNDIVKVQRPTKGLKNGGDHCNS